MQTEIEVKMDDFEALFSQGMFMEIMQAVELLKQINHFMSKDTIYMVSQKDFVVLL